MSIKKNSTIAPSAESVDRALAKLTPGPGLSKGDVEHLLEQALRTYATAKRMIRDGQRGAAWHLVDAAEGFQRAGDAERAATAAVLAIETEPAAAPHIERLGLVLP